MDQHSLAMWRLFTTGSNMLKRRFPGLLFLEPFFTKGRARDRPRTRHGLWRHAAPRRGN
jgi:hypothetical protein